MTDFVLLDTKTTLADLSNAVKMKWGYVTMTSVHVEVVVVNGEQKLKLTVQ